MRILSVILFPLALLSIGASCDKDGQHTNANKFENTGESSVKITYVSNADTVFLSLSLLKPVDFDNYLIKDAKGKNTLVLGKDKTEAILTHIPYNEPVAIDISLMSGTQSINDTEIYVTIDGIDHKMAKILIPDSGSVTAGDGMYSIALPDGRSIFLMGDSYIGSVSQGQRSASDHMYRNTYIVYDKGQVSAMYACNGGTTSAAVPADVTDESQKWYWPGHGFVAGNTLYIFQELMYQGASGAWGFRYEATHILEYSLPDIKLTKDTHIPYYGSSDVHFGAAALNDGDYLYIYAQVDIENDATPVTEVFAARTTATDIRNKWEYYDGSAWTDDAESAKALSGLSSVPVSSQFNVFKLDGKYVLLTQNKTFNSGEIYTFISDTPYGPWKNRKLIYQIPALSNSNWFTYNAMAHPQFNRDGMILVSYDVNTSVFSEQFSDVESYRPRFFWVAEDDILK